MHKEIYNLYNNNVILKKLNEMPRLINKTAQQDLNTNIEWKVLPSNPNYLISENGDVYDLSESRLKTTYLNRAELPGSYCFVSLKEITGIASENGKAGYKTKYVHRLVMEAFVGICPADKVVNHIDHNPKNNHISNLEYVTHKENCNKSSKNTRADKGSLIDKDIVACRIKYKQGLSIGALCRITGYSYSGMYQLVTYRTHNTLYLLNLESQTESIMI